MLGGRRGFLENEKQITEAVEEEELDLPNTLSRTVFGGFVMSEGFRGDWELTIPTAGLQCMMLAYT